VYKEKNETIYTSTIEVLICYVKSRCLLLEILRITWDRLSKVKVFMSLDLRVLEIAWKASARRLP